MPVDSQHPQYKEKEEVWKKVRIVSSNERAVKAARTLLLPSLSGQDDDEYTAYLNRASFLPATARTVGALTGAMFAKDPAVDFPAAMEDFKKKFGSSGSDINEFAAMVVAEALKTARAGVLVDSDKSKRPYAALYLPENIYNWDVTRVNDSDAATLVVLREVVTVKDLKDRFAKKSVTQFRVLELVDGKYQQQLYRKKKDIAGNRDDDVDNDKYQKYGDAVKPTTKGGKRFDFIPFCIIGAVHNGFAPQPAPMEILADVNASHYRNSADLEHGLHHTALPTAVASGFETKGDLKVGSTTVWVSKDSEANAKYLEFTGKGLGMIITAMDKKEKQMAALGGRFLETQKSGVEAAQTVKMRQSGEHATLKTVANTVSAGMTKVMGWMADWQSVANATVSYKLNNDFNFGGLEPTIMLAFLQALDGNKMSFATYYHNMERYDLYPAGRTLDQELALIEDNPDFIVPSDLNTTTNIQPRRDRSLENPEE